MRLLSLQQINAEFLLYSQIFSLITHFAHIELNCQTPNEALSQYYNKETLLRFLILRRFHTHSKYLTETKTFFIKCDIEEHFIFWNFLHLFHVYRNFYLYDLEVDTTPLRVEKVSVQVFREEVKRGGFSNLRSYRQINIFLSLIYKPLNLQVKNKEKKTEHKRKAKFKLKLRV